MYSKDCFLSFSISKHVRRMKIFFEKISEKILFLEEVCEDEIKPERNITHLNLS